MSPKPNSRAARDEPAVKHRPAWIAFVVLGAIFCLGMGAWQLARYQAATGTVQNLGYTFMWPFLAWFLIYAYFKYVRLEADEAERLAAESEHDDDNDHDDDAIDNGAHSAAAHSEHTHNAAALSSAAGLTSPADGSRSGSRGQGTQSRRRSRGPGSRGRTATEIPADLLPTRRPTADAEVKDEGLAAYNTYLADLDREVRLDQQSQEKPAS